MFLLHEDWEEVLFGGAAGGAKSDALLMAALQYVDVPHYAALIVRRTHADLAKSGALMHRAHTWLDGSAAQWNGQDKRWTFPSGASLSFGYLEHLGDERNYQSAEYQFIGIDELTQFPFEEQYAFLFSRLRRVKGMDVPIRMRAATNPGGPGHEWVKKRFLPEACLQALPDEVFARCWYKDLRCFVPSRLEDNPSLDIAAYEKALANLDPVTRAQLRSGDWKAHASGRFKPDWWRRYHIQRDVWHLDDGTFVLANHCPRIIIVDPANRKTKASKYTAMAVWADIGQDRLALLDMVRERLEVQEIVPRLAQLSKKWQPWWVGIENTGFQMFIVKQAEQTAGIPTVWQMEPEGKSKLTRATPAIIRAEQRQLFLPEEAPWLSEYEAEMHQFTGDDKLDAYTDQVDVTAYAVWGVDQFGIGSRGEPLVLGKRG